MRGIRKTVVVVSLVFLLSGMLSGCGVRDREKKPEVVLTIKTGSVFSMTTFADPEVHYGGEFLEKAAADFAAQYKEADVTCRIVVFNAQDEDKEVTGAFDTDNAADVLFKEYFNISTYIHSGRVVPLDDIITDQMREDISEVYWSDSRLDGKTYMMPFLGMQNVLAYNKELFRRAGLEEYVTEENEIQSWTLAEWEEILGTLRANLPPTVYPMMMYAGDNQGDAHTMTLLRSHSCPLFDEKGMLCVDCEEGIEALRWLRECNNKGYFPPNAGSMVILDNTNLLANGQLAISLTNAGLDFMLEEAGIDYGRVNFPSADGKGYSTNFLCGFEVFDNGDAKKVKAAKDFVRYIYETDWLDYSAGSMPVSDRVADKYAEELQELWPYLDNQETTVSITDNNPNWRGVRAAFYPHMQDLLYGEKPVEQIAREMDTSCNAAIEDGYQNSVLHE